MEAPVITNPVVLLTDRAVDKVIEFMDKDGTGALRVGVRGGGCSGFQYALALDEERPQDIIWEQDGVRVLCSEDSAPYLQGAILDYKDNLEESGFAFENPNATSGCGCGSSFRVDDQAGCDSESAL